MIVKPKIRGFICTTAHPRGCAQNVKEQMAYVRKMGPIAKGPKKVLIVGSSTGYGLSSRIVTAFGCQAATVGVFFEKPAENNKRTASAGWYNSAAFEQEARAAGLYAKSINADAFSDEAKQKIVEIVQQDLGPLDMVIYSLASPRRRHPKTGKVSKSILRPRDIPFTNKSIDMDKNEIETVTLPPATEEEIQQTVDVMGGEDWQMWIEALARANLLADGFLTIAYSYVGPELTHAVYRHGTIGAAKDHLEATAKALDKRLSKYHGHAYVSVNKALVTQSSSAIPFIPLYFILLAKVMKEKGLHEDCIQQIYRLFAERLYNGKAVPVDEAGRIRVDDREMRSDVQVEVQKLWKQVANENLYQISDLKGYHEDFLRLFGFGLQGVDYEADVPIETPPFMEVASPTD